MKNTTVQGEKQAEFNWVNFFRVSSRARDNERLSCIYPRGMENSKKERRNFHVHDLSH